MEAPPYDDVYEDVEMGGSTGADDEPDEVYATVSVEHKAQKRYLTIILCNPITSDHDKTSLILHKSSQN